MHTLTATLTTAQKADSRIPYVKVEARHNLCGVVNLKWTRLYSGNEPEGGHALTLAGNGTMVRLRAGPVSDSRKLYRQTIPSPGPASDFSQWTYLNHYNVMAVAAGSLGAEVSLFWVKSNGEIIQARSLDNGVTWQPLDYPGYAPTGEVAQMAASYKPNGDLALFFTDTSTLYVTKRLSGVWQPRIAWNKTTGSLSGVAAVYDGDWKLLISGQDTGGNYKIWSLIYGDGGEVAAGNWSPVLKTLATAPSDGLFSYAGLFLDKTEEFRCFFSEIYTGNEPYNRPFWSHNVPGTPYLESRWREPVPFEAESACGMALGHDTGYAWLSSPSGVWRAEPDKSVPDLSPDVVSAGLILNPDSGELIVELRNEDGRYSEPVAQNSLLSFGCQIDLSPGYRTAAGNETSAGLSFTLEAVEYTSEPGKAALILYASDGWKALEKWTARYQFRWNRPDSYGQPFNEACVKEILAQVLARCGLKLILISQSAVAAGFYPDFTVHPGESGKAAVKRLLSFIPDLLFLEGNTAYLVNPLAADTAVYEYRHGQPPGVAPLHQIIEGRYRSGTWSANRVQVEGEGVLTGSFAWGEIQKSGDILEMIEDLNIDTPAKGRDRGESRLRHTEIEAVGGFIRVPVNCGQQLYDVIEITDPKAGLAAARRRVMGITLGYLPAKGKFEQKLELGGP